MNPSLSILLVTSVIYTASVSAWLLWGEKRLASPIFLYLIFHLSSFVLRPWVIFFSSDQSFLHDYVGIWPYSQDHEQALWQANLGLIMFLSGGLWGERLAKRKTTQIRARVLPVEVVTPVGVVMLMLGAFSILRYGVLPGQDPTSARVTGTVLDTAQGYAAINNSSAYLTSFHVVTIGVFITWLTFIKFRWYYIPYLGLYFITVIYQGYSRTTYLLGAFALLITVLGQRGRRWPSFSAVPVFLLFVLSFLSGKHWLQALILRGTGEGIAIARDNTTESLKGTSEIFINYDTLLGVTYLIPRYVPHSDVSLYFRPFYFWIPRAIWPNKPIFDFSSAYITANSSLVNFRGLTPTLVGESFLAFGTTGVIVLMALFGSVFGYVHSRTNIYPFQSVERIFGLAFVVSLFQVYRDGIISLPVYLMFYFGPCLIMWFTSVLLGGVRYIEVNIGSKNQERPFVTSRRSRAKSARLVVDRGG